MPVEKDGAVFTTLQRSYRLPKGRLFEGPHTDIPIRGASGHMCTVCIDLHVIDLALHDPACHVAADAPLAEFSASVVPQMQ
jgi:hypothetical protein